MYVYLRIGVEISFMLFYFTFYKVFRGGELIDIPNGIMCEFLEVNLTKAQVTQL